MLFRSGATTIVAGNSGTGVTAANQNIVQSNAAALISTRDLTLTASGHVGAPAAGASPGAVQIAASGTVNAGAANGNVFVTQTLGDLHVGTVTAAGTATSGLGRVVLNADNDISAASGASVIRGNRVDLVSNNGAIGSIASPLKVDAGYTDTLLERGFYGVTAAAQGDIGIESGTTGPGNAAGNLLVNTVVSTGGDVKLVAACRILDNNPIEQIDTRTWNQLLAFWDTLGLRENTPENALKQQKAVQAYELGKIPAARCNADKVASRSTLERAGMLPCGHILRGDVVR